MGAVAASNSWKNPEFQKESTGPMAQAAGPTTPGGFNGAGDTGLSADDTAPAADPVAAPFGNHVSHSTSSGVPLYQQAALQPGTHLPELRLDLHVFAAQPQNRFVMINMHKLHEGDSLPEGVRVTHFTRRFRRVENAAQISQETPELLRRAA